MKPKRIKKRTTVESTIAEKYENHINIQYISFLEILPCAACVITLDDIFSILYANDLFYTLLGYTKKDAVDIGFSHLKFMIAENMFSEFYQAVHKKLSHHCDYIKAEIKTAHKNGTDIWLILECRQLPNSTHDIICTAFDNTSRHEAENELHIIEEEQRIVMQQTGRFITKYDVASKTLYQPQIAADMFGLPKIFHNVPYSVAELLVAEDSKKAYIAFYEAMIDGKPYGSSIVQVRNITGNYAWYALKYTLTYDHDEKPFRGIISYEDVTALQEKELAYKKWRDYFESQQVNCIAYYEYDLTQDTFIKMVGDLSEEFPLHLKRSFSAISLYASKHFVVYEDAEGYLQFFSRNKLLAGYYMGQKEFQYEHRRIRKDGTVFWALAIIQLVSDPYTNNIQASVLIKDINRQKESILKLEQLSTTDPLTGLLNRSVMMQKTDDIFRTSMEADSHILLMIDLDNFKELNDTLGHQFGDRALCDIAQILKNGLRSDDLVGRLGGDEFVVLLKNTALDANLSNRLQLLRSLLMKTYENGTKISSSIGLSVYPRDGITFEQLYAKADIALYQAKRNGRNQFVFYEAKNTI